MIMLETDYTQDAELTYIEIYDFDSRYYNETGINTDRMKLPTRYDISKFFERQKRNKEKGKWKKRKDKVDFSDDFDWQITYSFPNAVRNNRAPNGSKYTYGADAMSFRRLYLILCEKFNGGNYFIDDYFDTVYPHTIKPEIDANLVATKERLLESVNVLMEGAVSTKKGALDRRYTVVNRGKQEKLEQYEYFAANVEERMGEYLASRIKDDIINCLATGQIPLLYTDISAKTQAERKKVGITSKARFYATAQLIESLQLYVKIGSGKRWETKQGILV